MFNYNLFLKLQSSKSNSKIHQESFIKNEIAQRLLNRLEFIKLEPRDILVDGYIDAQYQNVLSQRFNKSKIHKQPQLNTRFDLIISNSTIHLTDNVANKLKCYYELLNNNGVLLFSTFGDKSFSSFNKAFANVDNLKHTNTMIDMLTWGNTLLASKYKTPAIESDLITFTYKSTQTLFSDIRSLNEPLADTKMRTTFTGKKRWQEFIDQFSKNLQLEIEALYGYAIRKADNNNITPRPNPNRISLEDLKKQIIEFKSFTSNT
ncbi:methyltransferase domain-containing protein [Allofrancisella guangzhouensis]|uniref:Biotin synthase n=1 Tax=Allofrancisella guangzhouensis TaxID=594679 RepID=A0A0A8E7A0_9GAMM|nr:methyltransferase domain-containing protein [Allofrancisella guangzhouensis]AJC49482.1 biotin synthase [Allofrancisella guangzhouensis]MBK2027982.1 methyltransferase domain-containing protein [Allofrancisella guangzhouensis]MBK2043858.1 methyltransferase domain-containing protein [Allofrancisella guangzhouensis]MBK2045888.1 methyltransferase domain-containing protein [Allofrancisella guangzhouensis]